MVKRYGLSKEQKAKIEPLLLEQQKQVHTLGEDESLTDAEWTAAVRKAHQATVLKVRKLLSDAQLSKYSKDEVKRAKQSGSDADADDDGQSGWASTGWRASTGRRRAGWGWAGRRRASGLG